MAVALNVGVNDATSATTHAVTVASPGIAAGNVAVLVGIGTGTRAPTSATDTKGNTWQVDETLAGGTSFALTVLSSRLATALVAGDVVTVTFSGTAATASLSLIDLGNDLIAAGAWTDISVSAAQATANAAVGSGTGASSAQADEIQIGVSGHQGSTSVTTTPEVLSPVWTLLDTRSTTTTVRSYRLYYRVVSVIEAQRFNATLSSAAINAGYFVTYKKAAAGGGSAVLGGQVDGVSALPVT